jgi:hypothetical protein
MRNARRFIRILSSMAPVVAALAVPAAARAAAPDTCADGRCSTGVSSLRLEGKEALRTSIDTGWLPSCDNGQEHCNKGLQVRADLALAAAPNGNLFVADLPGTGLVEASWENLSSLGLRLAPGGATGTLTVTHSISPRVELFVDIGPFESPEPIVIDGTKLLNKLPGAKFNYLASAAAQSQPGWAFGGMSVVVPPPALGATQLFSVDLPGLTDKIMSGSIALHARTQPTFTFKTKRVLVGGVAVTAEPNAKTALPMIDGDRDYIDLPATIEAELSAQGEMEILPSATLSRLGDMNFTPSLTITFSSVHVTKKYSAPPQLYTFKDKTLHIPLPNVRPVRVGPREEIEVGTLGTITAPIHNTGESDGRITATSSDPRFEVPKGPVMISPKSSRGLDIRFRPEGLETATATITVHSNDPDTPEFSFTVEAQGVPAPPGGGKKAPGAGADDDGAKPGAGEGCGCKTAGASGAGGLGALAGLGLGVIVLGHRRRRRG